jgi:hypothetical protein
MLWIQSRCLSDDFFSSQAKRDFSSITLACQARQSLTFEIAFRLLASSAFRGRNSRSLSPLKLLKEKRLAKALEFVEMSTAVFQAKRHYRESKQFVNCLSEFF